MAILQYSAFWIGGLLNKAKWMFYELINELTIQFLPMVLGVPFILYPCIMWPLFLLYFYIYYSSLGVGKIFLFI
jgi:hypothetical protein